jgi:hypothetical protein
MNSNPFVASSPSPAPGSARDATRAEATALVANVLSQSGIAGFRILPPNEIPKEWQANDAVWTATGVVGTVIVLPPMSDPTLEDIRSVVLVRDAKNCKGKFASGSLGNDPSAPANSAQLFTACDASDGSWTAYYTAIPRRAGGFYVFSEFGVGANSQPAKSAETAIREAVYSALAN